MATKLTRLNEQEAAECLNTINTIFVLDWQLTRLANTTLFKQEIKYHANQLAKQLSKYIESEGETLYSAFYTEMDALVDRKKELICESQKLSAEDWQYVAAMMKLIQRTDLAERYHVVSIFNKLEDKL
jgi:hypothetical protein